MEFDALISFLEKKKMSVANFQRNFKGKKLLHDTRGHVTGVSFNSSNYCPYITPYLDSLLHLNTS